jgi:hypothetical protein
LPADVGKRTRPLRGRGRLPRHAHKRRRAQPAANNNKRERSEKTCVDRPQRRRREQEVGRALGPRGAGAVSHVSQPRAECQPALR